MKKWLSFVTYGVIGLCCSGLAFSGIFPKDSKNGSAWVIQTSKQAVLTLDDQKGQLKLSDCTTGAMLNVTWHSKAWPTESYVSNFKPGEVSYKNEKIQAILIGTAKYNKTDTVMAIPMEINNPVQDGSGLVYQSVTTKMTGIPQNLAFSNVTLMIFMPKASHGRWGGLF